MKESNNNNYKQELDYLKKRYEDAQNTFRNTLTAITAIIVTVSIIMATLSIVSSNKIDDAIKDMERKFQILSGKALEKSNVEILWKNGKLDNKTIQFNKPAFYFNDLVLHNTSNKITGFLSIRIYFSENISKGNMPGEWQWIELELNDTNKYKKQFWYGILDLRINPKEKFLLQPVKFVASENIKDMNCKIEVFYGEDEPTVTNFKILIESN